MRNEILRRAGAGVPLAVFLALVLASGPAPAADVEYSTPLMAASHGKAVGAMAKVGSALRGVHAEFQAHANSGVATPFAPGNNRLRFARGRLMIDVVAAGDGQALLDVLLDLGLEGPARYGRVISGMFPLDAIGQLAALEGVGSVSASWAPVTNVGLVTSEGVMAMNVDLVHAALGLDGTGVTVGVLSDSYDHLGGAAGDQANDDLPGTVTVLDDGASCNCIDEGRAMMQLVHDVAPGADLAFHTAFKSMADFAQGIEDLGAISDVVVDDVIYFAEPMFQDGIVAQAVDTVVGNGAAYFSAAGNQARKSYESAFVGSGVHLTIGGTDMGELHDFDTGGGTDTRQSITIPAGSSLIIVMQWDEPFKSVSGGDGSLSDVDIYLLRKNRIIAASTADNILSGEPVEIFQAARSGTFDIMISHFAGPEAGKIKYVIFGGPSSLSLEHATNSSTVYGHSNAAGAEAVGAAFYQNTPAFGVSPPVLESFSSGGDTDILFDTGGTRLGAPDLRLKPEIVGPDGSNTTFFFSDTSLDPDSWPNFFGTSAAAPHVAAVAALMVQDDPTLTPSEIYTALEDDAVAMAAPENSGAGLVDAAAIFGVVDPGPGNTPPVANPDSYVMDQDTMLNVLVANGVLDNDSDAEGDPLTAVLYSDTATGTLNLNGDGSFTYTPATGFVGDVTFQYKAEDAAGSSAPATVTITVNSTGGGGNAAPVAVDDSYTIGKNITLVVGSPGVLANDTDADGNSLTAQLVSGPATGLVWSPVDDGSFTYTPDTDFTGNVTITYKAWDGMDLSNLATVNIKINKGKGGGRPR